MLMMRPAPGAPQGPPPAFPPLSAELAGRLPATLPAPLTSALPAEAAGVSERFKFMVCVDDSPQSRAALRFAALRAANVGGLLALLHVTEPAEFREWMSIAQAMEQERRDEAERLLHRMAAEVHGLTGLLPEVQIRSGTLGAEILAAIREDGDIHALVVGAAPPSVRKGQLISWLAGQLAGTLEIPLVVVPGNLTDTQIDRLA
ncbi:universal stress protein [Rhodocista pekingensis]|uniref:Universal stress protein n=1 Tax=Rhodocista pekingensis TaxID=201185 RepID=A0ABW2KYG3_9PROT